jgi:nucleoside-diphosphate-sugar epimerase
VNCWQWIDEILALAGISPVRKSLPVKVAWTLGGLFELGYATLGSKNEPPMTRFLAAQLGRSHYYEVARARQDFGYQVRISTAEGMRRLAGELGGR